MQHSRCRLIFAIHLSSPLLAPIFASAIEKASNHDALVEKATVTVYLEKLGLPIPNDFLGLSCEKKILSRDCFTERNTTLITLCRNLGPGVLRVGGDEVDSSFWSPTEKSANESMKGNGYSRAAKTLGPESINNLYAFARKSGWRVIHGVNLASTVPDMAADEAAYALSVGGNLVMAFEIGNEPNLYPKGPNREGIRPGTWGYAQYREEFRPYVTTILAKTPAAPLAGPAITKSSQWMPQFVADFKGQIALATHHVYPLSGKEADPKALRFASIENLMHFRMPQDWQPALEAAKAAGIPFRLGEWNTASGGGKAGVSDTFAAALWAVDTMFEVAKEGCAGVNVHGGFRAGNYAPICYIAESGHYEAAPLYYGLLMFRQAGQGRMVSSESVSAANFTAHAVMGNDHQLRVTLINKDLTHPVTVEIKSGTTARSASLMRLSAPSIAATKDVTLGGSSVQEDGTWKPEAADKLSVLDGKTAATLPPGSAALLTFE
ncbi:MAG: glycosyl hydrolase family 79 C-terminal domain-containing protein [Verrucomicrobiota bacterium]